MPKTVNEMEKEFDKSKDIDKFFITPLTLLKLTMVKKDNLRNVKEPYVKAEIFIPQEVGKTVAEVISSKWTMALLGIKYERKKKNG